MVFTVFGKNKFLANFTIISRFFFFFLDLRTQSRQKQETWAGSDVLLVLLNTMETQLTLFLLLLLQSTLCCLTWNGEQKLGRDMNTAQHKANMMTWVNSRQVSVYDTRTWCGVQAWQSPVDGQHSEGSRHMSLPTHRHRRSFNYLHIKFNLIVSSKHTLRQLLRTQRHSSITVTGRFNAVSVAVVIFVLLSPFFTG